MQFSLWRHLLSLSISCAFVAGCSSAPLQSAGASSFTPSAVRPALPSVPDCSGQHTKHSYSGLTAKLEKKGGSFCIPTYGGFGGSLLYPNLERSAKLTIRTSLKNLYYEPALGDSGATIVYLNLHFHRGARFGEKTQTGGGLTSKAIVAGQSYTAYGIVAVNHLVLRFPPCYSVATQGQYGGVFPNLGNLMSDTTVTGAGYGVIEIYPGAQVSQAC
jgi:hypothetical protein